jgi:hypothetical protein
VAQLDAVARRRLVGDERVGRLDAEARLGGARGRAAAQPRELLAQQPLPALLAGGVLTGALGPGERVGGVAALVLVHVAAGDLPGARAHRVEEPAVVGHHDERPAAGGEVAGQPVDALHVEVVRRLVEQQQVGVVEQRAGQCQAPALPARQRPERRVGALREAVEPHAAQQASQDLAPPAGALGVLPARAQRVAHRPAGVGLVALGDERHRDGARARHRARVGRLLPGDEPQQGRLALAVGAHHADALARGDAERHLAQDAARGEALVDVLEVDEVARGGHHAPTR